MSPVMLAEMRRLSIGSTLSARTPTLRALARRSFVHQGEETSPGLWRWTLTESGRNQLAAYR